MKDVIKKYFEELIKTDSSIKEVYSEEKLDDCITYIRDQAKAQLNGKNGFIEDSVVYHWARDFMLGDTKKVETKETTVVQLEEAEELAEEAIKEIGSQANTNTSDAPINEKLVVEPVAEEKEETVEKVEEKPMREVSHPKAEELHQLSLFDF